LAGTLLTSLKVAGTWLSFLAHLVANKGSKRQFVGFLLAMDPHRNLLNRSARITRKDELANSDAQAPQHEVEGEETLVLAGRGRPPKYRTQVACYQTGSGAKITLWKERSSGHRWIYQVTASSGHEAWARDPHQAMAEFASAALMSFYEELSALQESFCAQNPALDQKHESDHFSSPREWAFITFFQDLKALANHWPNKILDSWW
jgi:hypothetical protein